ARPRIPRLGGCRDRSSVHHAVAAGAERRRGAGADRRDGTAPSNPRRLPEGVGRARSLGDLAWGAPGARVRRGESGGDAALRSKVRARSRDRRDEPRGAGLRAVLPAPPARMSETPPDYGVYEVVGPADLLFKSSDQDQPTETQDDLSARISDDPD